MERVKMDGINVNVEADCRPMTKAELIADLQEMCEEVKQIRAGKLKGKTWEEFKRELHG